MRRTIRPEFKAVAIDLDGTSLRADGTMSTRTSSMLAALTDAGIWVVPATARPPHSTFERVTAASWAVCSNGALVVDREQGTLWERTFDSPTLVKRLETASSLIPGLGFGVRCFDTLIGNGPYFDLRAQPRPDGSIEVTSPHELASVKAHSLSFRARSLTSDQLASVLGPVVTGGLGDYSISANEVLDVTPPGVTKATGLAEVARRLGFGPNDVVAYGDMPNDAPMLAWAGLGVAIGPHPDVAAMADIVLSQSEDAVANHIRTVFTVDDLGHRDTRSPPPLHR